MNAMDLPTPDFRALFESAPGLYLVLTTDFRIIAVSDAYLRATMTSREEIVGRHLFDVFPDNPDDPTATGVRNLRASLNRVLQRRVPDEMAIQKYDIRRPASEGGAFEERYWSPLNSPVYGDDGEVACIIHRVEDVTEVVRLKQQGAELRKANQEFRANAEERFRLLVEGVKDYAIYMLDPQGRILTWNAGAQRIKGYTAEEILGQHFSRFYPREAIERGWPQHELESAAAAGRFEDEGWRVRKDGSRFWANVIITALRDEAGNLKGFAKVTRDLTERKEAEESLKAFATQLQQSNQQLEQFASVASHDLQEPLRKIQAFGDRLQKHCGEALDDQGREYLARMQKAAARMRTLINDLLAFARLTTKAKPLTGVNLAQVAQEVVSDLEERIRETGGRVEVGNLPTVNADPTQMRQLLLNLISNGLKFHRPGEPPLVKVEGKILAAPDRPFPDYRRGGPLCEITVQDNGIGFDEKYLDRIFEVFQRLHARGEYEGTGIGLAICRKIVERHGGCITAKSSPGQGATFIVTLPA